MRLVTHPPSVFVVSRRTPAQLVNSFAACLLTCLWERSCFCSTSWPVPGTSRRLRALASSDRTRRLHTVLTGGGALSGFASSSAWFPGWWWSCGIPISPRPRNSCAFPIFRAGKFSVSEHVADTAEGDQIVCAVVCRVSVFVVTLFGVGSAAAANV